MEKNAPAQHLRKLDDLGRLAIPQEIRDAFGWQCGQQMAVYIQDPGTRSVCIRPMRLRCSLCNSEGEGILAFKNGFICQNCEKDLETLWFNPK